MLRDVHPIERLRYVARSSGGDQRTLVRETATAISGLDLDPAGLVVACRRIVERHPTSGALWWLCASLVTSADACRAAWGLSDQIEEDPTADQIVDLLPDGATVCVAGWPDFAGEALIRRGDITSLVINSNGEGNSLVRRLQRADSDAEEIEPAGTAAAVLASDLVIVEALAAGPDGVLCSLGSHAAAAVAYCSEIPVWFVVGRGRRLPELMWKTLLQRLDDSGDGWELEAERVPLAMATAVVGPDGLLDPSPTALAAECPMAHELLRTSAM
ncbi:MAG: hypothetical protein JWN39_2484 [Ilumatobacteraceae bacterium]|nr:hypothetical protein [Ilumatobacteraceae bacterium]